MKKLLVLFVLSLTPLLAAPSTALAEDTECVGFLPPGTYDNVIVPPGQSCSISNSTVTGNIKALDNSRLFSSNNIVRGNIEGDKVMSVNSFRDSVGGSIIIKEATISQGFLFFSITVNQAIVSDGSIEIIKNSAGGISIFGNTVVKGNIKVEENATQFSLDISNNRVDQNLQVFKNRGPSGKFVQFNTVGGTLQCFENDPPFFGSPNMAGKREGTCF